jgi:hypothetical protein
MQPHLSAFALNFVTCHPFDVATMLSSSRLFLHNDYMIAKEAYTPIATDCINHSIDFLPNHEYTLYRVVKLIHPGDPEGILHLHPQPASVIVFQGFPLHSPSYTQASPT